MLLEQLGEWYLSLHQEINVNVKVLSVKLVYFVEVLLALSAFIRGVIGRDVYIDDYYINVSAIIVLLMIMRASLPFFVKGSVRWFFIGPLVESDEDKEKGLLAGFILAAVFLVAGVL